MKKLIIYILLLITVKSYSQYSNFYFNQHYLVETPTTTPPTVTTTSATSITTTSASSGGNVTSQGSSAVLQRGLVYSTDPDPDLSDSKIISGSGTGSYVSNLSSLTPNTRYYYRAYAYNSTDTAFGGQLYFDTLPQINVPTVVTYTVNNVQDTYVTANGEIVDDGGQSVYERGFVWNDTGMPDAINDNKVIEGGTGQGIFSKLVTGLNPGSTYYLRAYGLNSNGYGYGDTTIFTTHLDTTTMYTVVTEEVFHDGDGVGIMTGYMTSYGDSSKITEVGFFLSTDPNYLGRGAVAQFGDYLSWNRNYTFQDSTYYYITAYATVDGIGYIYGNTVTFYFTYPAWPIVKTYEPTEVEGNYATLNGGLVSTGISTINQRGFVYSIFEEPTLSDSYTSNGTSTGSYSANILGLLYDTTYYYKAYATFTIPGFPQGTVYGVQKEFRTGEAPYVEPIPTYPCNTQLDSAGNHTYPTHIRVELGSGTGTVTVNFAAYSVPDRLIIYHGNIVVYDTGFCGSRDYVYRWLLGPVDDDYRNDFKSSLYGRVDPRTGKRYGIDDIPGMAGDNYPMIHSNTKTFTFIKTSSITYIDLKIYAPMPSTEWNVWVHCL